MNSILHSTSSGFFHKRKRGLLYTRRFWYVILNESFLRIKIDFVMDALFLDMNPFNIL